LGESPLVSSRYRQLQLTVQKATPCSRDFSPEQSKKGLKPREAARCLLPLAEANGNKKTLESNPEELGESPLVSSCYRQLQLTVQKTQSPLPGL